MTNRKKWRGLRKPLPNRTGESRTRRKAVEKFCQSFI